MTRSFALKTLALASALIGAAVAAPAFAAGGGPEIPRQQWTFGGFRGHFDNAQLQRGFQVYKDVCAACHGLKRVRFRNLAEKGGPEFPEASVKALAASWPNQIFDGPNDQGLIATSKGAIIKRPPLLSDPILGPYDNEKAARAAQNGAYPPDLSLITMARSGTHGTSVISTIVGMPRDIVSGYQEGGADYLYALLTGYGNVPASFKNDDGTPFKLEAGMSFNKSFPGYQIAMIPPLQDGTVKYQDGTPATVPQYAKDVTAFLAWAGDPNLEERKSMGWKVMLYLLFTTLLLYIAKKRLWARLH